MANIDEAALDKAVREEIATRWKTHGPRVLQEYASKEIMDAHKAIGRKIVEVYLKEARS